MSAEPIETLTNPRVLTGEHYMLGDHACAEGAMAAGCDFFAGYPITPATEIAERMSERLPQAGGVYIQMEDEIASMAAIIGAAWGGAKTMTATSGPGFSLMMENLGLAIITETPCVIVNVQRAGPSTGLPTLVGQGDMMQARWGSHGPYEIIAICPMSPQELFEQTIRAFNLAERFRTPVLVMTDSEVGHMTEKVAIPAAETLSIFERRTPTIERSKFRTCEPGPDLVPPMPRAGDGYKVFVESLTHDDNGYPALNEATQVQMVNRLRNKILDYQDEITMVEEVGLVDADVAVVSYGISARVSMHAVQRAREERIRAGMLRLITAWPFPEQEIIQLARRVKRIIVVEINMGQMSREVERCVAGRAEVIKVTHPGGDLHDPADILDALRGRAQ